MSDTKTKTTTTAETFDVRNLVALWAEQSERFLDEMERATRASLEQMEKLHDETRRVSEAAFENARRVARAFA